MRTYTKGRDLLPMIKLLEYMNGITWVPTYIGEKRNEFRDSKYEIKHKLHINRFQHLKDNKGKLYSIV